MRPGTKQASPKKAPARTPQSRKGSRLLSARVPQQEKGPLRALFLSEDCLSPEGSLEPSGSHWDACHLQNGTNKLERAITREVETEQTNREAE